MLLSAVSFGLALLNDTQQLPKKDALVWESAKNSVVTIVRGGIAAGQAVLIDKSGLFLANQSAISTPTVQARLSDGRAVTLAWKSTDVPTQTVLLQAEVWTPDQGVVVTLHPPGAAMAKEAVIVVLPSGPVRGELMADNVVGVLSSSKRMFPLGEVRFEASAQAVAGAIVFDLSGRLVGLLNATLYSEEKKIVRIPTNGNVGASRFQNTDQTQKGAGGGGGIQVPTPYGPADTTTGYTVGPEVMRRVVSGFLSPTHKVQHPAIGVNCVDGPTPGAIIILVKPGSPAEKAGIQSGDVIIRMDDKPIRNKVDFARVIEAKDPGDPMTIVVTRDLIPHTYKLTVGTIQKTSTSPEVG